jgi:hypothetical protein
MTDMDKLVDDLVTERPLVGEPGAPAVVQVLVRVHPDTKDRWKTAADLSGKTLSDFIRDAVDAVAAPIIDCQHTNRQVYPWSVLCLDCGQRLK